MTEAQIYPTLAMLELMQKRTALEQSTEDVSVAIDEFKKRYCLRTALTTIDAMQMIITLFRIHAESVRETMDFKEKLAELTGLLKYMTDPIEVIGAFYCQLVDRYISGQYVFYGVLGDGKTMLPFDLKESETDFRRVTIEECGTCRRTDVPLFQCTVCKKAAYCNVTCQKSDYKFHKRFCSYFAKELSK